jgi:serine protease inhibitor
MLKCHGNIVFSPAGLCSILEILQQGTDIRSEIYDRIDELISYFNSEITPAEGEDVNLAHAISIWYNKSIGSIKEEFIDEIEAEYEAEAHHVDSSQKDNTTLCIDKWVADKTHNMIKSLDTQLSEAALMLVLDAIYMKAKWENPFDPALTDIDLFHNADGTESEVDMMYQDIIDADYAETESYQVISLPYKHHDYEMIVVLPKKGNDIDFVMNETDWLDRATGTREVELYMPRFKFDNTLSFVEVLTELGLGDMFNKDDSFPKITDLPIHVSQIKQQCVIDIAEEGTEAAAVTFAEFAGCPPPNEMSPNTEMRIDRPFGFAIRGKYDNLLFMGVVKDMKKSGL